MFIIVFTGPERAIFDVTNSKSLREIREAAGLTQGELSERCSSAGTPVPQSRISEYEVGSRFPPPDKLAAIATALGLKPERLFAILLAQRETAA